MSRRGEPCRRMPLLSLFSAIFRISKYERKNRAKLGWSPVRVGNVASFLDRTDQLDLVTYLLHNQHNWDVVSRPYLLQCGWGGASPTSIRQSENEKGGTPASPMSRWDETRTWAHDQKMAVGTPGQLKKFWDFLKLRDKFCLCLMRRILCCQHKHR